MELSRKDVGGAAGQWRLERARVLNTSTQQESLFVCDHVLEPGRDLTFKALTGEGGQGSCMACGTVRGFGCSACMPS